MSTIINIWALICLAAIVAVTVAARRFGRPRAAAALVVLGLVVLVGEEPAITVWLGVAGPRADPDGMSGLITSMARAHVIDAGVFGALSAGLLAWVALTAFKRGERWAQRVLLWGFVVVTVTECASVLLVFSRGLPLPGPGGAAGAHGLGWAPVAVGLLAWATGLWLARGTRPADAEPAGRSTVVAEHR
jgi:hypothetical protein